MSKLSPTDRQGLRALGWGPHRRRALRADKIPPTYISQIDEDDVLPLNDARIISGYLPLYNLEEIA